MKIEEFLKLAAAQGMTVYPKSADESEGTVCAIARDAGGKKVLFAAGMTYFISLVASIVQLLRLLSLANRRR